MYDKSIKSRFLVEDSICNIFCITTYVWFFWGSANCGRPGEQHSLILRPTSQLWKHSAIGDTGLQNGLFQDVQKLGQSQMRTFDNQELDSSAYAILVSCHCTHTGELALSCNFSKCCSLPSSFWMIYLLDFKFWEFGGLESQLLSRIHIVLSFIFYYLA